MTTRRNEPTGDGSLDTGEQAWGTPSHPDDGCGEYALHDLRAEISVLSSALRSSHARDRVCEVLQPECFYLSANRQIFKAMLELDGQGYPVDVVSIAGRLRARDALEQIGGMTYVTELFAATPVIAHAEHHAERVRQWFLIRSLLSTCQQYMANGQGEARDFVNRAGDIVCDIARPPGLARARQLRESIVGAFKFLHEAAERRSAPRSISTGFPALDAMISGLNPGGLYIVAGAAGVGKTALACNICVNVARTQPSKLSDSTQAGATEQPGMAVLYCSSEISSRKLGTRLLASEARVDQLKLNKGVLSREEWARLTDAAADLSQMPIYIDDAPGPGLVEVRTLVRRLRAELARPAPDGSHHRLGLLIIDGLKFMLDRKGAGERDHKLVRLSRELEGLARELDIPIVLLTRLARNINDQWGPSLDDLYSSSTWGPAAKAILLLHRHSHSHADGDDLGAEIMVAQQRHGAKGSVRVRWLPEFLRFEPWGR